MISVDIKGLVGRLNPYCTAAMEGAAGLCLSRSNYEVTVEHLLAKLIEDLQSDIPLVMRQFGVDLGMLKRALDQSIEEMKKGNAGKPVFSPILLELIQESWLIASIDLMSGKLVPASYYAFVNGQFLRHRIVCRSPPRDSERSAYRRVGERRRDLAGTLRRRQR